MFLLFSNKLGVIGSILVSLALTALLAGVAFLLF